jgi:DNA-binding response OmpR family regulator
MNEHCFRIFVVEDDPVSQMIVVEQLDDPHFEVETFDSGEACLAAMDREPDLILMDVEMPGKNGILVCRSLREAGDSRVQVIFISSHDDLETRLAAFDAGGNDFIVKPFAPEELVKRVRVAERFLQERQGLAQQAQFAQQTAFTAMSSMGEMGVVLQFLRASFTCPSAAKLTSALFDALGQYGLQGMVETRDEAGRHCFSSGGVCTPLEASIVTHASGMDRIFQFRDRLAINYSRITLLVPNLPLDNPDFVGRLRDNLALIAEGAETRLLAMESENQRLAQASGIIQAVAEITRGLTEIEAQQNDNRLRALGLANAYLDDLEHAFVHLGLTDAQEAELIALAKRTIDGFRQLQDDGKSLGNKMLQVTAQLRSMVA